ncbi:zf-HC2 domain-containing protein [Streptomyces sp. SS8]
MDHCDPTLSAALAFGEASEQETRAAERHLEHCAACREELAALRELADTARRAAPADSVSVRPPPRVWEAIAAGIAAERRGGGQGDGRNGGRNGTGGGPE